MFKIRQQLSKITQHASVVIEQERWFDKSGNPHESFHFTSVPDRSHQMIQIMEQWRGELVVLTNEVNHQVSQHEQVHDEMLSTMDTALDYMARTTQGLHECNVPDRQLCEAYQTLMRSWNGHMHGFRELVVPMLTFHDADLRRLTQDLPTHGKCIDTHAKQIYWLYTNLKAFTGNSLTGSPSNSLLDPPLVKMEKDIKAINQKLARVGDYGRTAGDVEQRLGSLATRIETIHQNVERVCPFEVRVHGLTENCDHVSHFEKDWREYENVC